MAANFSSYFEKLSSLLMNIGNSAPRYQNITLLYPRSKKLLAHAQEYFLVAVNFCHELLRLSKKSRLGKLVAAISDRDIKTFQSNFDKWAKLIDQEVQTLTTE